MIPFFNKHTRSTDDKDTEKARQIIGNYRVIKTLHESDRAVIYLAQEISGDPGMVARQSFMDPGELVNLVALKMYRAGVTSEHIAIEADALDSLRGPGVVELRDVLNLPDKRGLVMRALHGPALVDLWETRGSLSPGEMVTILASLVATLARISSAGYAHGAVWPGNIRFDDIGRPVLTGFSSARKHAPPNADWLDFYSLLRGCAVLINEKQEQMLQISAGVRKRLDPFDPKLPAWVEASLFRLADPQPLRFEHPISLHDTSGYNLRESPNPVDSNRQAGKSQIILKLTDNKYVAAILGKLKRPSVLFIALFVSVFVVLLMVIPNNSGEDNERKSEKPGYVKSKGTFKMPSKTGKSRKRSEVSEKLRKNMEECLASKDADCVDVMSEINADLGEKLDEG